MNATQPRCPSCHQPAVTRGAAGLIFCVAPDCLDNPTSAAAKAMRRATLEAHAEDACKHTDVGYIGRDPHDDFLGRDTRGKRAMVECRDCGLILPFDQSGHPLASR